MKSVFRIIILSIVILFALSISPAISMASDTGGIVSASDEQASSNTNSVRPSNVTSVVEPAAPPEGEDSELNTASKDGDEEKKYVAVAKPNRSIKTNELTKLAEVGTVTASRAEITLSAQNISIVQDLDWVKYVQKQRFGNPPSTSPSNKKNISSIESNPIHKKSINGEGVKIGLIGYGPKISNVPYQGQIVDTRNFKQGASIPDKNEPEHDTAALEQVSEMVPQSDLYITAVETETDFTRAIDYLINKNVDIILTEITFDVAPGDGTGTVAKKVDQASSAGITVVTPAGNGRAGHYEGRFYDSDNDGLHNYQGKTELNRIGGKNSEVKGEYRFTITWSDFNSNFQSDYDLYIYNERTQKYVASSNTTDYYPYTPAEVVRYQTNTYEPLSLVVYHRAGNDDDTIEIHGGNRYGNDPLQYNIPEGSIVPPATAKSAVSVAAYNTPKDQIAIYSNQGPIGSRSGITVTGYSHLSSAYYNNGYGGTSGAAPYVAGTVGLMNDASPGISPQNTKSTIRQTAKSLPKSSQRVGGGLIDAPAAVRAVNKSSIPPGAVYSNPNSIPANYDSDNNGKIDQGELVDGLQAYSQDTIDQAELVDLLQAYSNS